jgi:hypothetical protein
VLQKRVSDYLLKDWDLYEYYNFEGEREIHEITTNGHDVIAFMVKNGKAMYYNWDVFKEVVDDIGLLFDRKISSDDYAKKLYNKSKMIIEE